MKKKVLFYILAAAGVLLISVTDGFSFGSIGDDVNIVCAPVTPYVGNDCALCHTSNRSDPTAAKDASLTGGTALTDYFCPAPPLQVSLPENTNRAPAGIADFDGDGNPDVLLRNTLNGGWLIYLMAGTTVLDNSRISIPNNFNYELAGIADFNGDGNADILLRNIINGRWLLNLMNGITVLESTQIPIPYNFNNELAGIADIDGLNGADILLRNIVNGRWILNLMNGTTVLESSVIP